MFFKMYLQGKQASEHERNVYCYSLTGKVMREFGANLFRYKGILAVKGNDFKFIFQGVGMLFNGDFSTTDRWKDGEVRECRFVFIGRHLDHKMLEDGFMLCKYDSE